MSLDRPCFSFYVPGSHVDSVCEALFTAGAGRIGDYDCCAFKTLGQGQFRPLQGADPYLGNKFQALYHILPLSGP